MEHIDLDNFLRYLFLPRETLQLCVPCSGSLFCYPRSDACFVTDYAIQVGFAALGDLFILTMTILKTLDIRSSLREMGIERTYTLLFLRDGQPNLASDVNIV